MKNLHLDNVSIHRKDGRTTGGIDGQMDGLTSGEKDVRHKEFIC